jgi:hypothetical protein
LLALPSDEGPKKARYYLNGEVDKAAHPILTGLGVGLAKPDLLVHLTGLHDRKSRVIEVKHCESDRDGLEKDLESLSLFMNRANYRRGILLIYGDGSSINEIIDRVCRIAGGVEQLGRIELCYIGP